jgi:hypothetical protein
VVAVVFLLPPPELVPAQQCEKFRRQGYDTISKKSVCSHKPLYELYEVTGMLRGQCFYRTSDKFMACALDNDSGKKL